MTSSRLAAGLRSLGLRPGDRITLWMENGWRWMVAYYATLRLGGVVVPCNILLTADEVGFIVGDSGSKAMIVAHDKIAGVQGCPGVLRIVDRPGSGNAHPDLETLLSDSVTDVATTAVRELGAHSPATIGYTSGTTGRPKGAVLRHASILLNTAMTSLMHGRTQTDVVVSALPCTHVYGNIVMNAAVACGMQLVLLPRFDEASALEAIAGHRATMFEGVPTMFMKLLNFAEFDRYDLGSLRICTVGGQTMPVAKMEETERRFGCPLPLELWA
jgi:long-chain acyl-CoA synthetase